MIPPVLRSICATGTAQLRKPSAVAKASNAALGSAGTSIDNWIARAPFGSTNEEFETPGKSRQLGSADSGEARVANASRPHRRLMKWVMGMGFSSSGGFL